MRRQALLRDPSQFVLLGHITHTQHRDPRSETQGRLATFRRWPLLCGLESELSGSGEGRFGVGSVESLRAAACGRTERVSGHDAVAVAISGDGPHVLHPDCA